MTEENQKPTAIDLFAGAGGFPLAAKKAGFRLLASVEYDKWAQQTYIQNVHFIPEAEIDLLVYKLYNLTEEEIAIVEGRLWN